MLSTLANLSLGALYERFLPLAGRRTGALLIRGYVVTGLFALPWAQSSSWSVPPTTCSESTTGKTLFPLCVATLAAFALADSVLVGCARPAMAVRTSPSPSRNSRSCVPQA